MIFKLDSNLVLTQMIFSNVRNKNFEVVRFRQFLCFNIDHIIWCKINDLGTLEVLFGQTSTDERKL